MNFGALPLTDETQKKLAGFYKTSRLPHALLLEGAAASQREELADLLAKAAVCEGSREEEPFPCGVCRGCVKAQVHSHPDISHLGGQRGPSLRVDEIRRLRRDAFIKPNEAKYKAYILLEAQEMTAQAQNALLKLLEEPPPGVVFLLTAPSASLLLPTICSRLQGIRLEETAEEWSAELSELVSGIAEAICLPGEAELLYRTADFIRNKEKLEKALRLFALLFRDSCVFRAGGSVCLSGLEEAARDLAGRLTRGQLIRLMEVVKKAQKEQEGNANNALLVTCFCARLRSAAGF